MTAELVLHGAAGGAALAIWLTWMTVWTWLLFALARAVDRAASARVSAAWRTWLYAPIALRLLLPAQWASPVGLLSWQLHDGAALDGALPSLLSAGVSTAGAGPDAALAATLGWNHVALAALLPLYAVGVVTIALAARRARRRLRALLAASDTAPAWMHEVTGCAVVLTDGFGPAVVGRRQPIIAIPSRLAAHLDRSRLRWILRHEAAHVRRGDLLVHDALLVATALLWPLVPVWLAARRVRSLLELACDETTLRGASPRERQDYMSTLIELTRRNDLRPAEAFAPGFAGGAAVLERVRALRHPRRWPRALQAALVLLVTAVAAGCTSLRGAHEMRFDGPLLLVLESRLLDPHELPTDGRAQVLVETKIVELAPASIAELGTWLETDEGHRVWRVERSVYAGLLTQSTTNVLQAPTLVAIATERASIFVGDTVADDPDHAEIRGMTIELLPTIVSGRDLVLDVDFESRWSDDAAHLLACSGVSFPADDDRMVVLEPRRVER